MQRPKDLRFDCVLAECRIKRSYHVQLLSVSDSGCYRRLSQNIFSEITASQSNRSHNEIDARVDILLNLGYCGRNVLSERRLEMSSLEQVEFDLWGPVDDGVPLQLVLSDAICLARKLGAEVRLSYHGRIIKVRADSNLDLLARDYERCRWGFIDQVGPYPEEISKEQLKAEKMVLGKPWEV